MTNHKKPSEMTTPPDLESAKRTGPVRTTRPLYVDRLPPCNHACPAGENIQAWLALAQDGRFREAWEIIMKDNPMPAIHGRACYHPCEDQCNRRELDQPVSIHAVERFLGDMAIREGWRPPAMKESTTGARVLIVGAGPSGLSAAYHLARLGHSPTIVDAGPVAGGMMHFGIPKYRLPRDILEAEIRCIQATGVDIELNHKVTDVLNEQRQGNFAAVFVAVGAQIGKRAFIPTMDAKKIVDALSFLHKVEYGEPPVIGRRVAILGGGDTAMDAARTAKRLGASEAVIVYHRDRAHMSAHQMEADQALEEGVKIHWLRTIREMAGDTFTVEIMRLDEHGWPQPTGAFETLTADSLILALGQDVDTRFIRNVPGVECTQSGTVVVDDNLMTGHAGLFAGGDMVPGGRSVTIAVGHGKRAARCIDAWLQDRAYQRPQKHEPAVFDLLNVWYYTDAAQRQERKIDADQRQSTFSEVIGGFDENGARFESRRCLSCGNCFECDGCYAACPESAIIKLGAGHRYRFDYDRCTGCAICCEQCPCGAITMTPEPTSG